MSKNTKQYLALLGLTSLLLMVIALYNGFGLTESDTGAYIEKGILNVIPKDRSPFYGWYIRYTSMWSSLWYTMLAQCLLLGYLLLDYITLIQRKRPEFRSAIFTVICIVAFTCVAWVAGYLMPDVFAGILLLASLLFLSAQVTSAPRLVAYALIIAIAILVHNSHFLIMALFSLAVLIIALVRSQGYLVKRSVILFTLSVLGWVALCSVNAGNGYGFTVSRGSHVFMVTKFAETGILNKYLEETCPTKKLKLCNYQEEIPAYSWDFLWPAESPLYKTGGWDSNKVEFDIIIHDVFTTPKYLKLFMLKSATATLRELSQVQAPEHATLQGVWSSPWQRIGTYFDDELNEYTDAKQNHDGIGAAASNYIYYLFFILTTIWLLCIPRIMNKEILFLYTAILIFFIVNAFVTSVGSTVIYRFQYRVFWVLPATNCILLIGYYWQRFQAVADTYTEEKL